MHLWRSFSEFRGRLSHKVCAHSFTNRQSSPLFSVRISQSTTQSPRLFHLSTSSHSRQVVRPTLIVVVMGRLLVVNTLVTLPLLAAPEANASALVNNGYVRTSQWYPPSCPVTPKSCPSAGGTYSTLCGAPATVTVPVATYTQCSRSINDTVGSILNVVCCLTDTLNGCVSETPSGSKGM